MKNDFLKYCLIALASELILLSLLFTYGFFSGALNRILNFDFLVWDAIHVQSLVKNGYDFPRTAFFPFFPYLWKITALSSICISLVNGIVFLVSASWLAYKYKLRQLQFIGLIVLPSMMFMFLPYAEAWMYCFSACFLVSLNEGNKKMQWVFLFLMTLTKPTAGVFIPAVLIAEFMSKQTTKKSFARASFLLSSIIIATTIVFFIQRLDTSEWFWFFDAQKAWGNYLQWPSLPLDTWENPKIIWLDFSAMSISLLATMLLGYLTYARFVDKKSFTKSLWYSLLYLSGTGLFVLLFRGGALFSLNRFVLASPFLFVAIGELRSLKVNLPWYKVATTIGVITLLFSLLFGSYLHIKTLFFFLLVCLLIACWIVIQIFEVKRWQSMLVLIILAIANVYYSMHLIQGGWVA